MFRKIYFKLNNKISFIFKRSFVNMTLNTDKTLNVKRFIKFILDEKELVHMIKNKMLKKIKTEYNVLQYDKYASTFSSKGVDPSLKLSDNFLQCQDDFYYLGTFEDPDNKIFGYYLVSQIESGKCYDDSKVDIPGYHQLIDLDANFIYDDVIFHLIAYKKNKFRIETTGVLCYLVDKAKLLRGIKFDLFQHVASYGNKDVSCFYFTKKQIRILIEEYNTSFIDGMRVKTNLAFDEFVTLKIKNFELSSKRKIKDLQSCSYLSIDDENLIRSLGDDKIRYGTDNNPYCKITLTKKNRYATVPNRELSQVCVNESEGESFKQILDRSILDLLTSRISAERTEGLPWLLIDKLSPKYGSTYVKSIIDDYMFCPFFVIVIEEQHEVKNLI